MGVWVTQVSRNLHAIAVMFLATQLRNLVTFAGTASTRTLIKYRARKSRRNNVIKPQRNWTHQSFSSCANYRATKPLTRSPSWALSYLGIVRIHLRRPSARRKIFTFTCDTFSGKADETLSFALNAVVRTMVLRRNMGMGKMLEASRLFGARSGIWQI